MRTIRPNTGSRRSGLLSLIGARLLGTVSTLTLFALIVPTLCQAQPAQSSFDEMLVVDCLLPGQHKRIGNRFSFIGPRRPARLTAGDCAIRGGEYVEYDRANLQTAKEVWLSRAQQGDAVAQNTIGEIFEKGLGTDPDFGVAAHWYELAAQQGNASAQFNLGKLYETGRGVPADREKALTWYREAAGLPALQETPGLQPASLPDASSDADGPVIDMIDPQVPQTRGVAVATVASAVTERLIIGKVRASSQLRAITVNDTAVVFEPNGLFQTRVPVREEGSRVSVVAVDELGRRGQRVFVLQPDGRDPQQIGAELGRFHALVIGINDYQNMNPLVSAVKDARVVAEVLRERYGFNVRHLENADRGEIMRELNDLRKNLTDNDNLLIYYAGHGTLDEKNDRGHWLPVDAAPDDSSNWISNTSLTDQLNIMAARHILVIADSCYSGSLTRTTATTLRSGQTPAQLTADFIALNKRRSRTALTSGGLMPVLDSGRGGHSVFANALIDALRSNSGVIDGQQLLLQIRSNVAQAAFDRDRFEQVPVYAPINLAGHEFGEFFLVPR